MSSLITTTRTNSYPPTSRQIADDMQKVSLCDIVCSNTQYNKNQNDSSFLYVIHLFDVQRA